jgi:hypothetical protein
MKRGGEDIVLVDTDATAIAAASRIDLPAVVGNVLDADALEAADIEGRHGIIGLIPNEGVSLLATEKARREFRVRTAHIAVRPRRTGVPLERLRAAGTRLLFGRETDISFWIGELATGGGTLATYQYVGAADRALVVELVRPLLARSALLPLVLTQRGRSVPIDEHTRIRRGDLLTLLFTGPPQPPGPGFRPAGEVAGPVRIPVDTAPCRSEGEPGDQADRDEEPQHKARRAD